MKNTLLVIILFVLTNSLIAQSGWQAVSYPSNGYVTKFMKFKNANTGFLLYDSNYLKCKTLRTTNGGVTWDAIKTIYKPTTYNYSIDELTVLDNSIWITVNPHSLNTNIKGWIFKSTNNGNTWDSIPMRMFGNNLNIGMFTKNIGYLRNDSLGSDWRLFKTTNGGSNWFFWDWAAGGEFKILDSLKGYSKRGSLYYQTTDAGNTWGSFSISDSVRSYSPTGDTIFACTPRCIKQTCLMYGYGNWRSIYTNSNYDFDQVQFINNKTGWASIYWHNSQNSASIIKTTDGGHTWSEPQISWIEGATYLYSKLCIIDSNNGWFNCKADSLFKTTTGGVILKISNQTTDPREFSISQNYPNPFNPTTSITYQIPKEGLVTIKIFDITGKEIETLVNSKQSSGKHTITWNASKYSSGVYFYQLKTENLSEKIKMILLK